MKSFNLHSDTLLKPVLGLEFPLEIGDNYSPVLKKYWGNVLDEPCEFFSCVQKNALEIGADFISVYFNLQEPDFAFKNTVLHKYKSIFANILKLCKMPLMIKLSSHVAWDCEIFDSIADDIDRDIIISPIQSANYEKILKRALKSKFNHKFVLRTPIDINLTKELNILSIDEGVNPQQIFIDPDMGCIGYGIDYGYSIIERICLARRSGDKMLDMPIIVYAGEEAYKAKETKSTDFAPSWGDLEQRAKMWEISTASSLVAAGANIVVCWHPDALKALRKQFCEVLCH